MALKQMRDSDMPLIDRINAALNRIHQGHAAMRIPAEATDHDVVLADCKEHIAALEKQLRRAEELFQDECDPVSEPDSYAWLQSTRELTER
jgi:pyridoxal biosynthesis lyase PdxS